MAEPLKTGPARMALAAVELHMEKDENYQIKLLPTCITFTHREKFRSDVVLIYSDPIIVDKTWINNPKRFPTHEDAVKELQHLLRDFVSRGNVQIASVFDVSWGGEPALRARRAHSSHAGRAGAASYTLRAARAAAQSASVA